MRRLCGCGSVWMTAISGLPSVTECTSVVAPPTSTTTRSPTVVGEPLGGQQHGPGVGRMRPFTTSPMRSMPGACVMCSSKASWMTARAGTMSSSSMAG